ncbi:MAG TPA: alpha/beta hydrolase [Solirubrobacteraceae bacterium]|nr:alpha/beta hydrolase [Solirubrobacteraceae bacterium]
MTTQETATASTIELRDGRRLAFAEYGDPAGAPVFFMHGFTASRITRHPDDRLTESLGVRLITLDRPGCGASDMHAGRTLRDIAGDVQHLAEALGVARFAVLGHSAGGPYALACALALPDRVAAAGVACGFAPMDRPGATDGMRPDMARGMPTLRRMPWLARVFASSLSRQFQRDPGKAFETQFGAGLPDSDRRELERPEVREIILRAAIEGTRGGARGLAREMQLISAPWGFDPHAIEARTLLWYGGEDPLAPPQMGRYLADALPNARLTVYPGEGHMVYVTHWEEILTQLREATQP